MSVASSTVPRMDPKIVAGERVDVLLAALRQMKCRKTRAGWVRISATLDRELGEPLRRALTRVERKLLNEDRRRGGTHSRTAGERRADALVVLALRLAEALDVS
jgi:hypothetical protein